MKKIIMLFIVMGLLTSGTALAGRGHDGDRDFEGPKGSWWKIPAAAETLKITKEEADKLDALYVETQKKQIELKADLEKKRLMLDMALEADTLDRKACLKLFDETQAIRNKISGERFAFFLKTRELLGKDRFKTLTAFRNDLRTGPCPAGKGLCDGNGPSPCGQAGFKAGCPGAGYPATKCPGLLTTP